MAKKVKKKGKVGKNGGNLKEKNLNAMFLGLQKLNAGVLPQNIPPLAAYFDDDDDLDDGVASEASAGTPASPDARPAVDSVEAKPALAGIDEEDESLPEPVPEDLVEDERPRSVSGDEGVGSGDEDELEIGRDGERDDAASRARTARQEQGSAAASVPDSPADSAAASAPDSPADSESTVPTFDSGEMPREAASAAPVVDPAGSSSHDVGDSGKQSTPKMSAKERKKERARRSSGVVDASERGRRDSSSRKTKAEKEKDKKQRKKESRKPQMQATSSPLVSTESSNSEPSPGAIAAPENGDGAAALNGQPLPKRESSSDSSVAPSPSSSLIEAAELVKEASSDPAIDDLVSFANLVTVSVPSTAADSFVDEDEMGEKIQRVQRPPDRKHRGKGVGYGADLPPDLKEHLRIGTDKMNQRLNQGFRYLVEHGVVEETPESVAEFLYQNQDLSKVKIGCFLGSGNPFNVQVLEKFVEKIDFSVLLFDDALRLFLSHFRLPGEAQQIDRMMEHFASSYCGANPSAFKSKDTAYVLAFALIMLNTDAHNPNVAKKMTKEEFLKSLRGIDTEDLSEEFLTYLYNRIVTEEIKMEEEHSDFSNPDMEGWMYKQARPWLGKQTRGLAVCVVGLTVPFQGGRVKTWKKRYTILSGHCLYYFKDKACTQPCGIVPLENLVVKAGLKSGQHMRPAQNPGAFVLYNPNHSRVKSAKFVNGQVVEGHHDNYTFCALSGEEREEWMDVIQGTMENNPYYGILLEQKRSRMMNKSRKNQDVSE